MMGLFMFAPGKALAQGAIYEPGELTSQPKIADANQARTAILRSYTSALQEAGLEGKVDVAFVVNTDGSVDGSSITVVSSPADGLSEAAKVAVAKIQFVPGEKDGQKVRCQVVMPIRYTRGE
jgi:TonB family protein